MKELKFAGVSIVVAITRDNSSCFAFLCVGEKKMRSKLVLAVRNLLSIVEQSSNWGSIVTRASGENDEQNKYSRIDVSPFSLLRR